MGANTPGHEDRKKQQANANRNTRYSGITAQHKDLCPIDAAGMELLIDAIHEVTRAGDLISFGRTSDGGAWVIAVFHNGQRFPAYAHTAEELTDALLAFANEAHNA